MGDSSPKNIPSTFAEEDRTTTMLFSILKLNAINYKLP